MSSVPDKAEPFSLHQARYIAMMKLLRILRTKYQAVEQIDHYLIGALSSVALAKRSLLPGQHKDSSLASFTTQYCKHLGTGSPTTDSTEFARAGAQVLDPYLSSAGFNTFIESQAAYLIKVFAQFQRAAGLDEPLALGWLKQCQIKTSRCIERQEDGHQTRASLDDLAQLTQWFTPAWIAEFLVQESLPRNALGTFLDPACGAGHLLVPALRRLYEQKDNRQQTCSADDLATIFEKQLFGIDNDPELIKLANFALYVEARDLAPIVDLPEANLFCIEGSTEEQAIGSLALGTNGNHFLTRLPRSKKSDSAIVPRTFDAVAMNPPYLSHRRMPQAIRDFLKINYASSQYDLYAAFLELGLGLLAADGRLAAICQQSVLTIQRYERLRSAMLKEAQIEAVMQLGSGSFATKGGEKVNNAILIMQRRGAAGSAKIRYWQLLSEEEKLQAELHGVDSLPVRLLSRGEADKVSKYIPNSPFAFWAPREILQLFKDFPPLEGKESGVICTNGLFTCNNSKFVRRHDQIEPGAEADYVPYDKGGGHKWYRTSALVLLWKKDGREIREYRTKRGQSARLPGEEYYFKTGVTYSYIGTKGFKARLLTPNSVFDIASSAVFSDCVDILYLLGFLNSSLVRSILGALNPTINFQIGDIRRIPFQCPVQRDPNSGIKFSIGCG